MGLFGFLFQRKAQPQGRSKTVAPNMPAAAVDPRASGPHLDLLCYFLGPKAALQNLSEDWAAALGETPEDAVQRLLGLGLLERVSLAAKLERAQTVADLRTHLKARGLPVSGIKPVLVARLTAADERGAVALVAAFDAFDCTPVGVQLAQRRLAAVAELKVVAVERSRTLIQAGKYAQAVSVADAFKATHKVQQRFQRSPFAIKDARDPTAVLTAFATARPRILGSLPAAEWQAIGLAAAMDHLWGGGLAPWLPADTVRVGRLPHIAARVMLSSYVRDMSQRDRLKQLGIRHALIVCGPDECDACKAMAGQVAEIQALPELPNPACTNEERGCLCFLKPVMPGL